SLSPSLSFPLSTFIFLSLSIALYSLGFHVSSVFYFLSLSLFHFPRFTPSCSSFHRSPSLSLPLSPSPSPSLALSLFQVSGTCLNTCVGYESWVERLAGRRP